MKTNRAAKTVITLPIQGTYLPDNLKNHYAQKAVQQLRNGIGANLHDAILAELLRREVENMPHLKVTTVGELIERLSR